MTRRVTRTTPTQILKSQHYDFGIPKIMNALFRRSVSIAPAASRQTLAALLRLIPLESFASSAIFPLDHVNGSPPTKKDGAFEIRRDFHFASCSTKKGEDGKDLLIAKLNIDERIVKYLDTRAITKLPPSQRSCFELAMQGCDIICRANRGPWKTLAFGIPIMDKILRNWDTNGRLRNPVALVLAPTVELARKIELEFRESAPLDTVCAYDGMTIEDQMTTLEYGVDAVFGTPGRIIDLIRKGALHLKDVKFAVLDGADQMLAEGFEDVETILESLPSNCQSFVFYATMSQTIENLTWKYLKYPATIDLVEEQQHRTKKIFVCELPSILTEEEFKQYFQNFGNVTDAVIKCNPRTQRSRKFGFITFDNEDAVDRVLHKAFHRLNGKLVAVRTAHQKDANPNSGSGG